MTIAPGHWLDQVAARSYEAMRAAGLPAGGINDAGRTRAEQEGLYAAYLRGELQATAAKPGESKHESGLALDVDTKSGAHAWLVKHGAEYGWTRPLSDEPWHFEYTGPGSGLIDGIRQGVGGLVEGARNLAADPLGLSAVASDARKIVLQGLFVLGGLGLIVLGVHRLVLPAVGKAVNSTMGAMT